MGRRKARGAFRVDAIAEREGRGTELVLIAADRCGPARRGGECLAKDFEVVIVAELSLKFFQIPRAGAGGSAVEVREKAGLIEMILDALAPSMKVVRLRVAA